MAVLLGSSGACEISVFHALVVGKGTKPFRLALSPVLIWLQAVADPAASMVKPRLAEAVSAIGCVESVTVTMTEFIPTWPAVGVPVIVPDAALIVNPLGSPVALKVYGVAPPAACAVALYEAPTVAEGNDVVVMLSVPAWPATDREAQCRRRRLRCALSRVRHRDADARCARGGRRSGDRSGDSVDGKAARQSRRAESEEANVRR